MDSRGAFLATCVTACTVLAVSAPLHAASGLSVTVLSAAGTPVQDAIVIAEPAQGSPPPRPGLKDIMDQRNLMFVPGALVVQTGTAVDFPNSDQVRHQVYSFSSAKTFQLALYAGKAHAPVLFDKPGLVTLGCNIHDSMLGYIYVTDSPWYGRTGADGTLQLHDLPPGEYTVRLWHTLLDESGPQLQQHLSLGDGTTGAASFRLKRPLRPPLLNHGADKKWEDY
jgi:plastocyanin